jgi:alpha-glucuronidase
MHPRRFGLALLCLVAVVFARAEDGYRVWLRYDRVADDGVRAEYAAALKQVVLATPEGVESPTLAAAREELTTGLKGLLGVDVVVRLEKSATLPTFAAPAVAEDGYEVRRDGAAGAIITGRREVGVLYGVFALLRHLQTQQPLDRLTGKSAPLIQRRMLNHWDNLNGTIERGYAGRSLWEWDKLPDEVSPRYRDYARANASLGLNGTVITNVNSDRRVLTPDYIRKTAALAAAFRPYGIRIYLTARFSAPIELGTLKTADPLDPAVKAWWAERVAELYRAIPDFGGFLVKANSEGQPGPQNYGRSHADGANLLAEALAPHGGVVIWRAFVYDSGIPDDRHKQAYSEFTPLDGTFRDNVVVQVKNGAIDFMPREPFHPLFGAMPRTPLALEVQITQEYLGGSTELAFLAPMWKETLDADTQRPRTGATVARIVDGSVDRHRLSVIAGVANTGNDRTWCGNQLAASNWYAFGRLAWDHRLTAAAVAEEWTRMTFSNDRQVVGPVTAMLLGSREAVVDYSMPLGLHHIMARNHHQGPGPWVTGGRVDWTSAYYHRADEKGVGFDRTTTGSKALEQYAPEAAKRWADLATCPDEYLLWFHHVSWDYPMRSGKSLWEEICVHYQRGVDTVRGWQTAWDGLKGRVDEERFGQVQAFLRRQEHEARIWRDACTQYFASVAKRPLPAGYEPAEYPLERYQRVPAPFSLADLAAAPATTK